MLNGEVEFELGGLVVLMSLDPYEPFFAQVLSTDPRVEILRVAEDKHIQVGYLTRIKNWPSGSVYWFVTGHNSRYLVEYLATGEEMDQWFDVWTSFESLSGNEYTSVQAFRKACISLWDSKHSSSERNE